jgi:hypothetical protein
MQCACTILYWHKWPVCLCYIFMHYLINGTIFGKALLNIKFVVWFALQLLSETFLILRRIERDMSINVYQFPCKLPVILVRFRGNLNFLNWVSISPQISNFMKIRPMVAELIQCEIWDRQTERRTDMRKLIVAFRNFSKASKSYLPSSCLRYS